MERFEVGDRVRIKALGAFDGHTGTIEQIRRRITLLYYVRLDGTALGHSIAKVARANIEHLPE